MTHSPPSPPPSAARLEQESIVGLESIVGSSSVPTLAVVCNADDVFTPIMGIVSSSVVGMVLSIVGVVSSIIRLVTLVSSFSISAEDERTQQKVQTLNYRNTIWEE